jgi:hypothetical protein
VTGRWKVLFALMLLAGCVMAQSAPKVSVSPDRIATPGHITVQGSGFSPKQNITSHLRRPDGAEYPALPLFTDDKGNFTHDIDTLVLTLGTHELWVVDDRTNTVSNHVRFEVTAD